MGQWRLNVLWAAQIGIGIIFNKYAIVFYLPFINICVGLTDSARGINIFGLGARKERKQYGQTVIR